MIVECPKCHIRYDDEFRWTICPHETFAANDGKNNFAHHPESYIAVCTCGPVRNLARVLFRSKATDRYYAWGCPVHDPLAKEMARRTKRDADC